MTRRFAWRIVPPTVSAPLTAPAKAYAPDTDRAGPDAHSPERLARWLALLILFLLEPLNGVRLLRSRRLASWWQDRPDLPPGSAQEEAASIRGEFGIAIAWMCRRRGIGPGHPDWPDLSRAIVAYGGSVARFRAGLPACGLQWWDNPNVVPGMTGETVATPAATAMAALLQRQAAADAPPPVMHAVPAAPGPALFPASRLPASWRPVLARAGPGSPTGPPGCPGLPTLSCLTTGAGAWPAPPS